MTKKKPSGYYWKERKRLCKKFKCKIIWKEKTIYVPWQIASGDNATELQNFASKYKHKIQTHL